MHPRPFLPPSPSSSFTPTNHHTVGQQVRRSLRILLESRGLITHGSKDLHKQLILPRGLFSIPVAYMRTAVCVRVYVSTMSMCVFPSTRYTTTPSARTLANLTTSQMFLVPTSAAVQWHSIPRKPHPCRLSQCRLPPSARPPSARPVPMNPRPCPGSVCPPPPQPNPTPTPRPPRPAPANNRTDRSSSSSACP